MPAAVATDRTLDKIVSTVDRVVVDFWAPWCAPCKQISPIIDALADTETTATFVKINADENPGVVQQYGVMRMPTILYFEDGQLVGELRQGITASMLRRRVLQWLNPAA